MKKISIIGSTGSIGTQTLEVVRENKDIEVVALSCGRNIELLEKQIREFKPSLVSVEYEEDIKKLKTAISDMTGVTVMSGRDGLLAVATAEEADIVVTAIVGMVGVEPTSQ